MKTITLRMQSPVVVFVLIFLLVHQIRAEDWPAFRGPANNGVSNDQGFPTEWSREKNVKWRVPLSEPGNSSPIVVGDRIFLTMGNKDGRERSLCCYHRDDGRELWKQTVAFSIVESTHKTNPFCPATPASDGKTVFVWHGSAGMFAYRFDGTLLWSREFGVFSHIWGLGASPIIVGDSLVQLCGPGERTFVVAMNRNTGEILWQTPDEMGGSESSKGRYVGTWSSPLLTKHEGKDCLICCLHSRTVGLDLVTGAELWSLDGISSDRADVCYAMPMVAKQNVLVMAGYGGPEFGFSPAEIHVTPDHPWLWRNEKTSRKGYHPQRIGTGVSSGDFVFMANADEAGSIECIDSRTGVRNWTESRTTDGPHWGSVVMAEGRLYIPGQKGVTRVISADVSEYKLIAENDLGEHCNATPAFSDGEIFIRTFDALYAIRKSP